MTQVRSILWLLVAFMAGYYLRGYWGHTAPESPLPAQHVSESASKSAVAVSPPAASTSGLVAAPDPQAIEAQMWASVDQLLAEHNFDQAMLVLQGYLDKHPTSPKVWLKIAQTYRGQRQPVPALDALFRALNLESDALKHRDIIRIMTAYLQELIDNPEAFNSDYSWLLSQLDELLKYAEDDSNLHLMMAFAYVKIHDDNQAQYHALIATNDPQIHARAQLLLNSLDNHTLTSDVVIPVQHIRNQYIVEMQIEGHAARMLIDTGASISGLSRRYTSRFPNLVKSPKPIRMVGAGGYFMAQLFRVDQMDLGSVVFNQQWLTELPVDTDGVTDGLLGIDILGHFDFVIDQNLSVLRLRPRSP